MQLPGTRSTGARDVVIWHEVWPKQRANVTRKRMSADERAYRARVRRNKTTAAVKASNARISADRTVRAKQRADNAAIIRQNRSEDRDRLLNVSGRRKKRLRLV